MPFAKEAARFQTERIQGELGLRKMVAKLEASFLITRACSPLFTKKTKWSIKRPTNSRASLSLNRFLQRELATPCTGA